MTSRRAPSSEDGTREGMRYVDWAEHRLRELVDAARDRAGVTAGSEEQRALPDAVRREPALVPLALIAVAAVLMVVSFFLICRHALLEAVEDQREAEVELVAVGVVPSRRPAR